MESPGSDLAIVRAAMLRQPAAVERLADRLRCVRPILVALNLRWKRPLNDDDISDMVQNVVLAVWTKLEQFLGTHPIENWIFGFCRIEVMSAMQRKRRSTRNTSLQHEPEDSTNPGDLLLARGRIDALLRGLDAIESKRSEIIRLKHFEDLTFEEIGQRLAISPNTAKTHYYRGLADLQTTLRSFHHADPER